MASCTVHQTTRTPHAVVVMIWRLASSSMITAAGHNCRASFISVYFYGISSTLRKDINLISALSEYCATRKKKPTNRHNVPLALCCWSVTHANMRAECSWPLTLFIFLLRVSVCVLVAAAYMHLIHYIPANARLASACHGSVYLQPQP